MLPLETPAGYPNICVSLDIVPPDVPALLGLDLLDRESLMVDTVTNHMLHRTQISEPGENLRFIDHWRVSLTR